MTITEYKKQFASAGGKARAAALTTSRRAEIAKQAAISRWKNKSKKMKIMLASKIKPCDS